MSSNDICAIIVLYHRKVKECQCLAALADMLARKGADCSLARVIVYDNSPETQLDEALPRGVDYVGDPANGGVAKAYNYAMRAAQAVGCPWLLLLDQDTCLDAHFFEITSKALWEAAADPRVVAIVPHVQDGLRFISPARIYWGDVHRPLNGEVVGVCDFEITAIGSGVIVNVGYLEAIGGFDEQYWLDCADRKLFYRIWQSEKRVLISPVVVQHNLSIVDYDGRVTEARYENILRYEWKFHKECKGKVDHFILLIRLLYRAVKLMVSARNKNFGVMTLVMFFTVLRSLLSRG